MNAIGMKTNKSITLPRLSRTPHLSNSFAPKACDVNVSYAQFIPTITDNPKMFTKVIASPTPAVINVFSRKPMK